MYGYTLKSKEMNQICKWYRLRKVANMATFEQNWDSKLLGRYEQEDWNTCMTFNKQLKTLPVAVLLSAFK